MTKIAWVFPGQGSQAQGMGVTLQETEIGKQKFQQAEEILGWSVLEICEAGDERLSQTLYTQPCLYTVECILVDLQKQEGKQPDLVAGHSLGEYVALYAAGVYDFAEGLKLVKRRAELMSTAAGGKMVALMKFDRNILESAIASEDNVVIANDNSEGQVVISGKPEAIDIVLEKVQAKKAVELNVSGAFHSPFMAQAANEFTQVLDTITFKDAQTPIMSNVDPTPSTSASAIKQRLIEQMTGGVRWREIMLNFPHQGITEVVEVGPGKVLTGLIKRTNKELNLSNISA
ncbi:malonyl CoA-acyl carrier protein transacylase [Cyanobacterium stanieri PCC 7202]|uniref:Malonyl CoA-acyl carrier protein transacylase n=1 Tax=Cyanobacterium stanieri (strain ATCC 29140 / PCC 7202) TaxID=292563 RepID=K9YN52_CYASC|nr:malonyl CoA-acyl carrier protein transacylase [Cyanobacterium stanieri PCC 7202]